MIWMNCLLQLEKSCKKNNMKINVRILLITFSVIVLVSLSTTYLFYTLTSKLLSTHHSKSLLNSANDFAFEFQSLVEAIDDNYSLLKNNNEYSVEDAENIDFIFEIKDQREIDRFTYVAKESLLVMSEVSNVAEFVSKNPNIILRYDKREESGTTFYGKVITQKLLDKISEKVRSEITLVLSDTPYLMSNSKKESLYLKDVFSAINALKLKNNFDLYSAELENVDFLAVNYRPKDIISTESQIAFILFSASTEALEFRETMKLLMVIITLAGIFLAGIFVLVFTTKLRKQISYLSEGAEITASGDMAHRVTIIAKDEVGNLGEAFNKMLDRLQEKEEKEKRYTEFVTLINQNPTLKEIAEVVLDRLVDDTGLSFGSFYVLHRQMLKLVAVKGINTEQIVLDNQAQIYRNVIEKKDYVEMKFSENLPSVKTGMIDIFIKYLLVVPIIYNDEVVAILELASESEPKINPKEYLAGIKEQMAVGLNNAVSYERMEKLVKELRTLNDNLHKQNEQIEGQNKELKELEKQLREKAEELEIEKEKAEELTKVKSQFLARMSHELKTPLNSIIGLSELVEADPATFPRTRDRLQIVLRNGRKLLGMINNILEYSKIESGKIEINKTNFLLMEFVEELFISLEPLVIGKNIEINLENRIEKEVLVNTDKRKLEHILLNLVSNAVKYTEEGKVILSVNKEKNGIRFDIIDTGIGISEEDKTDIFKEFQQIQSGNKLKIEGAGLGLTICEKFTELLGGIIKVEPNKKKGTTFSVIIPEIILELLESKAENTVAQNNSKTKGKILIVAPDSSARKLLERRFNEILFKIDTADSAIQAIEKNASTKYSAILITPELSDRSGWNLLSDIKGNRITESVPCFVYIYDENRDISYTLNCEGFLHETGTAEQINSTITSLNYVNSEKINKVVWFRKDDEIYSQIGVVISSKYNLLQKTSDEADFANLKDVKPDLIIADVGTKDGKMLKFADDILKNPGTKNLPLIINLNEEIDDELGDNLTREMRGLLYANNYSHKAVFDQLVKKICILTDSSSQRRIENSLWENDVDNFVKPRVLIVDDDNDTLYTVAEIVQKIGCDIVLARNGVECLEILKDIKPDLVLLDIMMPEMDGFATIKKIRKEERLMRLPVFALTAHAMLDDKEIIKNNGFTDLITKPVNAAALSFRLQSELNKRRGEK